MPGFYHVNGVFIFELVWNCKISGLLKVHFEKTFCFKYKPTLVVEWTYKHGAKDELILSCTEHIGPNDELKLRAPCGYYVQLYVSVHS